MKVTPSRSPANPLARALLSAALLLVFFGLALAQVTTTSPTFDEGFTLLRGYAALRTGHLVPIGHPPLAHWLSALGVVLEPNLPDPRDLQGWYGDKYDESSHDLLWERGLNTNRLVFLGRLPILLLGLILGAVTARWAKDLLGWPAALVALGLHAFSPNLLAQSAVATTDLPVAAFYVFALYGWYRFARQPSLTNAVLTGVLVGGALASKFSALLLGPTLAVLGLIFLFSFRDHLPHKSRQLAIWIVGALLAIFIAIWATYGFAINPYPLAQYLRELTDLNSLASEGHTAYLFGLLSLKGWWYYHPVVLLVKTPLPLLALLLLGVASLLAKFRDAHTRFFLTTVGLPALIFLAAVTLSSLNVGYRYLLPALPLLHILAAAVVPLALRFARAVARLAFFTLLGWYALGALLIAPHFLAYFNELVGPANGYQVLVDSNLDWGQDLPALAQYLDGRPVNLSYFGRADPAYYGIRFAPLPGWPPPGPTHFAPADPAPGLYAISASNLVGVQLTDPNTYAYFRNQTPLAVINYSIFIYQVGSHAPVSTLAQCSPPVLNQNAVGQLLNQQATRQISFDCANSLIIPAQPALLLYPSGQTPLVDLGPSLFDWKRADGSTYYQLYWAATYTPPQPLFPGQYLSLLDYTLTPQALTLRWLVTQPAPPPVSVFVHFNWPDGALADNYDALGVPAEEWQTGDILIQRHPIAADLPTGQYGVEVGLYSLADGTRYSDINLTTYIK